MTRTLHTTPTFQLRLALNRDVVIGPGKADLLERIDQTGSISAAGRSLTMSYKKAWHLIETMNHHFPSPLVATSSGGNERGGAHLTELGQQVLAHYRALEKQLSPEHSMDAQALLALMDTR
ncbi:LysR family transcriptional regulator [Halomonas aquamarina]|uniref:LysR family transcriptional regulator n=1 Tax=Vreelandella aquamarina TaxID=77097 RepID=A0ACC5VVZ8_9GAMM|nr:winged helix-turn-helix domain-containing protein [Halomonas aquamarina]MBZ5488155.1 LysR family transcriptional regulator [Halomonas aquamarina]